MSQSMITENQARTLIFEMQREIELVRHQLSKSRAARGASEQEESTEATASSSPIPASPSAPLVGSPSRRPPPVPPAGVPIEAAQARAPPSQAASPPPRAVVPRQPPIKPITATRKQGTLLRLSRRAISLGASTAQLIPQYVVADEKIGVALYASQEAFETNPVKPQRAYRFWIESVNSRGSRFKKAAVCWPLLLPEDDADLQQADPSYTYFSIDFPVEADRTERVIFATRDVSERDAWVHFLTKYIDLYLAPRAESETLQYLPRGAEVPLHKSSVLDGEAPGGNVL